MPFSWSCSSSSYAASTASACSTGAPSTFLIRSTRASTGVKPLKSTATAMVTPFFAVLLDLNELRSTRHTVILPCPLALHLNAILRRWLAGEARVLRLERVGTLLLQQLQPDGRLLVSRSVGDRVEMRTCQHVDGFFTRVLRQVDLITLHAVRHQQLDLQ